MLTATVTLALIAYIKVVVTKVVVEPWAWPSGLPAACTGMAGPFPPRSRVLFAGRVGEAGLLL